MIPYSLAAAGRFTTATGRTGSAPSAPIERSRGLAYHGGMPRIRRDIPAVKIEYLCDRCERGVYRLIGKRPVDSDYVYRWQHRCSHCGDLAAFSLPYPRIEVDGKLASREFVLRDALPPPSGPRSAGFSVESADIRGTPGSDRSGPDSSAVLGPGSGRDRRS